MISNFCDEQVIIVFGGLAQPYLLYFSYRYTVLMPYKILLYVFKPALAINTIFKNTNLLWLRNGDSLAFNRDISLSYCGCG